MRGVWVKGVGVRGVEGGGGGGGGMIKGTLAK